VEAEIILILGGARSGKSFFAQRLATKLGRQVLFIATATSTDEEMRRRIELHQKARPSHWRTLETPSGVAKALKEHIGDAEVVILDCLSLLIANLMSPSHDPSQLEKTDIEAVEKEINAELEALLACAEDSSASLIIVSNEVGMGVVPPYPSGRAYRDLLGRASQFISERADKVYMMIAGLPIELKALSARDQE
jgi:adenosylcobinamide kinase/adenosylcobinamide-phosphate guanylyltransferase